MKMLLAGLAGAMLATSQLLAASNLVEQTAGVAVALTNDPARAELDRIMADDDAAMDEIDGWIRTNDVLAAKGEGETKGELNQRIHARLGAVQKNYEDFIGRYPNDADGHLAYGSFLDDIGQEDLAAAEYESASKLDPKNPAAWNDLGNYYGEAGGLTNAFADYQKAIDLDPSEPVYYQNLATTVYLFRKDAEKFYGFDETQVFDKALELYRKAVQLDPSNFDLACDYAETYYGIRPLRTNDALVAWTNALNVARNDAEREGVYIHLARIKLAAGQFAEAQAQLDEVTNGIYAVLKDRLQRNLLAKENPQTNAVENSTATNSLEMASTNFPATNGIPAMTNPPPFSTNEVSAMTNVPPVEPIPAPQTNSPPVNPTNLLNEMEVTPPTPRAIPPPQ